jgi:hypothetical protein
LDILAIQFADSPFSRGLASLGKIPTLGATNMKPVALAIEALTSDPRNARKHDDRNIEAIMKSLQRFGQQKPIVISKDRVVYAGNGTLEAAKRLGWKMIQCAESDLSGDELRAYAIADNRTAELATWDEEILGEILKNFENINLEVSDLGFEIMDFIKQNPDYAILEDEESSIIDEMRNGVRKAIQIEFELEHYEEARALVKFWREHGANVGIMLVDHLKKEKTKL